MHRDPDVGGGLLAPLNNSPATLHVMGAPQLQRPHSSDEQGLSFTWRLKEHFGSSLLEAWRDSGDGCEQLLVRAQRTT